MKFSTAAVFSNHCVLQRNKIIKLFGSADSGNKIEAFLYSAQNELICSNSTVSRNEKWVLQFPPLAAGTGFTLKLLCTAEKPADDASENQQEIVYTDVAVGEVWLAGGQSNMEFELQNCTEGPRELSDGSVNPNVRFYYTNKISWKDEKFYEAEKNTCWQTWESEWKKSWSAVGYFFGKQLALDSGVTVGIIGCNWGGTSASAWMRKEFLEKDIELKTYLDEQEEAVAGKSIEMQLREYDEYEIEQAEWQKKCDELYRQNPMIEWNDIQEILGPCKWPGPKSCKNPYRPTGLYDCMLSRIIPYTVKGVIWYQGESDDHKPSMYYKLFSAMIHNWRLDWNDLQLPFIFVQLPEHRYKQDKDFRHWCFIREAQLQVNATVKNAFMTCALDLGQYNDIHPKAKKVLGERMEKIALAAVYNSFEKEKAFAPEFENAYISGNRITLSFKNASDGFVLKEDKIELDYYKQMEEAHGTPVPSDFTGFEIAGSDGKYFPAEFEFSKTQLNQITVWNEKVKAPVFARYAWYNYGPVTVFGKNELPLAPFRTSLNDTQAASEHAEIQQIMTV